MPIKAENRGLHLGGSPTSKLWHALRALVLERAGRKCEQCGAPHMAAIIRRPGEYGLTVPLPGSGVWVSRHDDRTGVFLGNTWSDAYRGRSVKVVLTIAHLNHDPTDNDGWEPGQPVKPFGQSNLGALCQTCHLRHDHDHHRANAARTRRSKLAAGDLFEGGTT